MSNTTETFFNFSRTTAGDHPLNIQINQLIERSSPPDKDWREYLGASIIGSDCLRKVQLDWMRPPEFPARIKDIFERGHYFEEVSRAHLRAAGFKFLTDPNRLQFTTAGGLFRGHTDGILIDGPAVHELVYPCVWEHKGLNAKGFHTIQRDGLVNHHRVYAAQVAIYQAYLDVTNPALFTVTNADTCERLHFLVPFDAALAQEFSDRAVAIIKATQAGELLPRITNDPAKYWCRMCSHADYCWKRLPP